MIRGQMLGWRFAFGPMFLHVFWRLSWGDEGKLLKNVNISLEVSSKLTFRFADKFIHFRFRRSWNQHSDFHILRCTIKRGEYAQFHLGHRTANKCIA